MYCHRNNWLFLVIAVIRYIVFALILSCFAEYKFNIDDQTDEWQ